VPSFGLEALLNVAPHDDGGGGDELLLWILLSSFVSFLTVSCRNLRE
jgi:hypothetical protein